MNVLRSLWPEGQGLVQGEGLRGSYGVKFPLTMCGTGGPALKWEGPRAEWGSRGNTDRGILVQAWHEQRCRGSILQNG